MRAAVPPPRPRPLRRLLLLLVCVVRGPPALSPLSTSASRVRAACRALTIRATVVMRHVRCARTLIRLRTHLPIPPLLPPLVLQTHLTTPAGAWAVLCV